MSQESLQKFCLLVLEKPEWQADLKAIEDKARFIRAVLELGRNMGFEFSGEEIEAQMRENRRNWHERWI